MNHEPELSRVPRRRLGAQFWAAIVLVFSAQLSIIFVLSDRSLVLARKPELKPVLRLNNVKPGELFALEDPTLFVVPHALGFAGEGWMKSPVQQFESRDWSESPRWLSPLSDQLGSGFPEFIKTNEAKSFQTIVVEPSLVVPPYSIPVPIVVSSALWLEGALKDRRLLSSPELRPGVSTDLLTNTVVQVLVDSQGYTFSAVLRSSSGSKAVDDYALRTARQARFESIEAIGPDAALNSRQEMTLGLIVFQWETLTPTNTVSSPLRNL